MRQLKLAGLTVRLSGGEDGLGGGDGPLLLLMHGYGAPGDDLVAIGESLRLPRSVRLAFPEAPLSLSGNGDGWRAPFDPRAWWQIDVPQLQVWTATGQHARLRDSYPVGLDQARKHVIELLDALQEELDVSSQQIAIGGFSQGAILACDVVLHEPRPFAGVIVLSGSLVGGERWAKLFEARRGTRVFQSHGTEDPILPYSLAEDLHDLWHTSGWEGEFIAFPGGHGIGPRAMQGLDGFLTELLGS